MTLKITFDNPVAYLIAKFGSKRAVGELVELSGSAIEKWIKKDGLVPVKWCKLMHKKTGIPLKELNPFFKDFDV